MSTAEVQVNGRSESLGVTPHVSALDWLREPGPDRRQGGLRGGGVRRLRHHGRAPVHDRGRHHRVGLDQCLPDPCRGPGRPGGRHLGGARHHHGVAPGAARDGDAGRLAVRLLHAGLHLQHGGGVLPGRAGPGAPRSRCVRRRAGRRSQPAGCRHGRRARRQRLRPARAERQPVPLHRLPADQGRCLRARRAGGRRPVRGPAGPAAPGREPDHDDRRDRRVRASAGPRVGAAAAVRAPRSRWWWRVDGLGRRGQHPRRPGAAGGRDRTAPGAARPEHHATTRSGSAPL